MPSNTANSVAANVLHPPLLIISYIRHKQMLNAAGPCIDRIRYFDGLGRPVQTVEKGITPNGNDFVDFTDYDKRGRAWRQWTAMPIAGMSGAFISNLPKKAVTALADARPYEENIYEESPWGRTLRATGAGNGWKEHPVKTEYAVNKASGEYAGMYATGTLKVVKTTDEDGRVSYNFTDKQQRVVLSRLMKGGEAHDTHYVYDEKGRICFVLQPMYQSSAN